MIPNRPTPDGYALGAEIARMADAAEAATKAKFPNARERCKTYAFRKGTFPNGCESTVMDAMKAVLEFDVFYCHEKPHDEAPQVPCAGWFSALSMLGPDAKAKKCPWEYSYVDDDPRELADESYIAEAEAAMRQ